MGSAPGVHVTLGKISLTNFISFRYSDWQKKTKISIPRAGERELQKMPFGGQGGPGERKYRHTKVFPADPNSKRSQARFGGKNKGGKGEKEAGSSSAPSPAAGGRGKPKREIKSAEEMLKQRTLKEKRKEKTGRHGAKFKAGGRGAKGGKPKPRQGGGKPKSKGGRF